MESKEICNDFFDEHFVAPRKAAVEYKRVKSKFFKKALEEDKAAIYAMKDATKTMKSMKAMKVLKAALKASAKKKAKQARKHSSEEPVKERKKSVHEAWEDKIKASLVE
jgi:hypothetical protein